jgi:serine/threonine-protein kinase HipA
MTAYRPRDFLHLWLVSEPSDPIPVGELNLLRAGARGVSLRYSPSWIARGFSLSEDLPLVDQEFLPAEKDTAAGAVDDARPDRWGERVIRFLDKPPRLSLLEYLWFAGDERFGALGVSTSADAYEPRRLGPLPRLEDTGAIRELVRKVLENEPVPADQRRLIDPGATMGGAKPKALLEVDGTQWVVKFGAGEDVDAPLVEHASMTLASVAGIRAAETRAIRVTDGHAVAIRRFDRSGHRRHHALSAHVALRAAGVPMGYPELAELLRRRGTVERDVSERQRRELFRRMVFNILIDNTDDHEKNHALLVTDRQTYELSPAFDVLPAGQALGYQQMRVGENEADSTIENALSMCPSFGLTKDAAAKEARKVSRAVDGWKDHFEKAGVTRADLASLEAQIDRRFLLEQRKESSGRGNR